MKTNKTKTKEFYIVERQRQRKRKTQRKTNTHITQRWRMAFDRHDTSLLTPRYKVLISFFEFKPMI
jgi:hypothetical protein